MSSHWKDSCVCDQHTEVPSSAIDKLIPGSCPNMQRLKKLIEIVAPGEGSALILGETGVGKELVARAIHRLSGRKGEFVAINCAAVPAELLEAELFGHEKGAFTGADRGRVGLVEQARGGTLFLDEIGDMPLAMQAKLLRVLESREIRRVGGNTSVKVDFRLVAATHRGLTKMVETGAFRQDLYYRLAVFPLEVPSLAEHAGDLPIIIDRLLSEICPTDHGVQPPRFGAAAQRALAARRWPGNVRELRAVIERAAALFPGHEITAQELERNLLSFSPPGADPIPETPLPTVAPETGDALESRLAQGDGVDLRIHIRDIEVNAIAAALRQTKGCVSRAADLLRLRRTTLIEKMRKYGIDGHA